MTQTNKDQATERPWINITFGKAARGGDIYPQNCHYSHPTRIHYTFPNATTGEEFKDCQVAMDYIEKSVDCHDELVEALESLMQRSTSFLGLTHPIIKKAKQALAKAGANE